MTLFLPLYNRPLLNIQFAMPITWTCVRWLSRYGGVYTVLIILIRIRIKKKEQICPKLPCAFVLQCLIQLIAWFALLILSDNVYRLLQLCALIHSNLVSCSFTNLISYWTKVVTNSPWHLNKGKNPQSGLAICHKLWNRNLLFFGLFSLKYVHLTSARHGQTSRVFQ